MTRVPNPVIPDYRPKKKEEEKFQLDLKPCLHCGKAIKEGYYARYCDKGVCSRVCMFEQDKKPKYPGHSYEEYLARQGETFDQNPDILKSGE